MRYRLRPQPEWPAQWPPLSVLKPMLGVEADLHSNLLSLFNQEYPQFEVLFGFQDADDPGIGLVEAVRRRYPQVPSQVVLVDAAGPNRKASVLAELERRAAHEILVVSDQDMRFPVHYLRHVAAPFDDPKVGLVTCPYRSNRVRNLGGIFEALTINVDFIPSVMVAQWMEGLSFALGATMAPRRQALREIGGFATLQPYLADDYQLGNRIAKRGWRLHLSGCMVDNMLGKTSLRQYFLHQLRWGRTYRVSRPLGYFFSIVMNGTLFASLCGLLFGTWKPLVFWMWVRFWIVLWHQIWLCEFNLRSLLWVAWVPVKDLAAAAIWVGAFFGNTVEWGGRTFVLRPDGTMHAERAP